jgi:hypothetical protein
MKNQYIKVGSKFFAVNFKAATSSFIRAIISAHYPDLEDLIQNKTSYASGRNADNSRWHVLFKYEPMPDGETVLIVRNPVERFRSACAETGKSPEEVLSEIESGAPYNNHFWPTSRLLVDDCKLYRFETDLDEAATELGLTLPLPVIIGGGTKPDLTPEQVARVEAIYADDIVLHDSITEPGQVYFTPATDEDKASALAVLKENRNVAEIRDFDYMGHQFQKRNEKDVLRIREAGETAEQATALGLPFAFRSTENVNVVMTPEEAHGLRKAMNLDVFMVWAIYGQKEAAISNVETLTQLVEIDLTI